MQPTRQSPHRRASMPTPIDPLRVIEPRLERAIARLSSLERDILFMHRLDNLTYAEIAERLAITTDEVEQRMARILLVVTRARRPRRDGIVLRVARRLGLRR